MSLEGAVAQLEKDGLELLEEDEAGISGSVEGCRS